MSRLMSHDLAKQLLKLPNKPIEVSIDVSTNDEDSCSRVFSDEYHGINDIHADEYVLLFTGIKNF